MTDFQMVVLQAICENCLITVKKYWMDGEEFVDILTIEGWKVKGNAILCPTCLKKKSNKNGTSKSS